MASQRNNNASGQYNMPPQGELGRITADWIKQCHQTNWMPDRFRLIGYLQAIQERAATGLASTVNSNTQALRKITEDIEIIKKSALKKPVSPSSTPFKDALLRAPSKPVPAFKHNEIVIKVGKDTANFIRGEEEEELVRSVNTCAERNGIQDINIRAVTKLPSGDVAIQTRNLEETLKLKGNSNWVTNLYGPEAIAVAKTYPMLIHTHKMDLFRSKELATFRIAIKQWNGGLEPIHVAPLQPGREGDVGALIMTFRTMKEANEAKDNGIVIAGKMHTAEVYNRDCRIKQCFNCYKYGHLSTRCTNKTSCGRCAHSHETPMRGKPQPECLDSHPDKCVNCGQGHTSYSKACPHRQREYERIKIARINTPERYTGEDVEEYVRDTMPDSMNMDDIFPTKTPRVRGRKSHSQTNTQNSSQAFSDQTATEPHIINARREDRSTPILPPKKKSKTRDDDRDGRSRSPRKTDTLSQTRQPLAESNHVMNTRKKDSYNKHFLVENSQENDENRPIEIPSTFPYDSSCQ